MLYTLENFTLKLTLDTHGAEIKAITNKATGFEYLWSGDPKIWGRTAPVLFPFVGTCKDHKYRFEGKEYEMTSHGFARDVEHEVLYASDNEICFSIKDTEESYENYPFRFEFLNIYRLEGNSVSVTWIVKNPGQDREDQTLYFSLGAHPAFTCPIHGEKNKSGYSLYFEGADEIHHYGNLTGTCTHEHLIMPLKNNRVVMDENFFERSTFIIENRQTKRVGIEDPDGHRFVTVDFDTPLFAVWSPAGKNAPFICIEPWCGRADYDDYAGDLPSREYGNSLAKGQEFKNTYTMKFE